jgi:AraC-like DNA-binding protein
LKSKLPLPNEQIYAPYKIDAVVEVLAEQGIPPEASLKGSGVGVDKLYDAFELTSVRQYLTVCENAVRLATDPATALEVGRRLHLSAYGIYGYALLSCLSLREYFRLAVKYRRLATPPVNIEWTEHDETVTWTFVDPIVPDLSPRLWEFLIEQQVSLNVAHLQEIAGRECPPLRATFSYPAPAHADLYPKYLGCHCEFDAPACELIYERSVLDQKPQKAHRLTTALLQKTCDRLVTQEKTSSGLSGEVYQVFLTNPGDFPSMDTMAARFNMVKRTLRRRLEAEGTSFQSILDDVRSSLAQEYLQTTKMSASDIATLLGFSDAANFRRALKRWTGKGPKELRG